MTYFLQPLSLRPKRTVACGRVDQEARTAQPTFPVTIVVSRPRDGRRQIVEARQAEGSLREVFKQANGMPQEKRLKAVNAGLRALLSKLDQAN